MLPFIYNVWKSRKAPLVQTDDPWGWGRSLEWATSCPPPRHNFDSLPTIRSESPAFDLHHPEVALEEYAEADEGELIDAPTDAGRVDVLVDNAVTTGEQTARADTDINRGDADQQPL